MAQIQLKKFDVNQDEAYGKEFVTATFQITFSGNEIKRNRSYYLRVWVVEKNGRLDIYPARSNKKEALWQKKGNVNNCPGYLGEKWIKPDGVTVHTVTLRRERNCLNESLSGLKGDTLIRRRAS